MSDETSKDLKLNQMSDETSKDLAISADTSDPTPTDDSVDSTTNITNHVNEVKEEINKAKEEVQEINKAQEIMNKSEDIPARFIPNTQTVHFTYSAVRKPPFINSVLFWKILKMFRYYDQEREGEVYINDLLSTGIKDFIADEFSSHEVVQQLYNEIQSVAQRINSDYITIEYFLEIISYLCQYTNKLQRKQVIEPHPELDRLATKTENDTLQSLKIFHSIYNPNSLFSRCFPCCYKVKDKVNKKKSSLHNFFFNFNSIEARFGASVVSYFTFASNIFYFNLIISILMLPIIIPAMLQYDFSHSQSEYQDNSYYGLAFGAGMEHSFLFYGYYQTYYFNNAYNLGAMYVVLCIFIFILSLYAILKFISSAAEKLEQIESNDMYATCNELFTALNYQMNDMKAIELSLDHMANSLILRIKQHKEEVLKAKHKVSKSLSFKLKRYFGYFLTFLIVTGSCTIVALLIIYQEETIEPKLSSNQQLARYAELIVPSAISFFKIITPFLIFKIVAYENYELAEQRFKHLFSRLFAIRMFFILVALFQTMNSNPLSSQECPQTQVGVIYYSLLSLDIVIDCFSTTLTSIMKYLLRKYCKIGIKKDEIFENEQNSNRYKSEFQIEVNIINIMYHQALIWSGLPYSPCLPFLYTIGLYGLIHVKKFQVLYLNRPPIRLLGVAKQQSYFRSLLVISLIIAIGPFSYFLKRKNQTCGPHIHSTPLDVLWSFIDTLPAFLSMVIYYLQNVVVLWIILILSIICIKFLRKSLKTQHIDLTYLTKRIKFELLDLQHIIQSEQILLDDYSQSGQYLFKIWMTQEDMYLFAQQYMILFQDHYFDDVYQLCKLDHQEIEQLLTSWHFKNGQQIKPSHIQFFQQKLDQKRRELL